MAFTIRHKKVARKFSRSAVIDEQYSTIAWRRYSYELRASKLKCEISGREYRAADLVVDHIIPVNEGGSFWDPRNHQVISKWQHNKKTGNEKRKEKIEKWVLNEENKKIPIRNLHKFQV